jgi:hypothetical protein
MALLVIDQTQESWLMQTILETTFKDPNDANVSFSIRSSGRAILKQYAINSIFVDLSED